MLSDEQIIKRILNGHSEDFRELLARYQKFVFSLAHKILYRREDAEDAVQETFLRVYTNLESYTERGMFWAWLRRITVNTCLKRIPHEVPTADLDMLVGSHITDVEAEALRQVDIKHIMQAVMELPAAYRIVVVLRYQEDMACNEIADLLNESPGTVRTRLYRAHRMLAARLAVTENEV